MRVRVLVLLTFLMVAGSFAAPLIPTVVACDAGNSSSAVRVPEPLSLLLVGSGLACMALWRRKPE